MFDLGLFEAKNKAFNHQNNVQVRLMFDKMVFDLSLEESQLLKMANFRNAPKLITLRRTLFLIEN